MMLSNYPPSVCAWDINHLCQENFPATCPCCGGEIADPSYLITDGPSVDICGEVYHSSCAAEMLSEALTDDQLEACRDTPLSEAKDFAGFCVFLLTLVAVLAVC